MEPDLLEESLFLEKIFRIIESRLKKSIQPTDFFNLLKSFLEAIDSKDPNLFHYDIARKALGILDASYLSNQNTTERLAREFLNQCHHLKEQFTQFQPIQDELFIWDRIYIKLLSGLGKTGKSEAKQLAPKLKQLCEKNSFAFWFQSSGQNETSIFRAPAFLLLAASLWKDRIKKWITFETNNLPALTTTAYHRFRQLLSAQMSLQETSQQVQIIHEENLIGNISIPTIPSHLMPLIFRGAPKLNSVYGHRLFRYEVQEPFRQMVSGKADYRVLKLDGGFTELAQRLRLKGKKAITILKEILYAQAHLEFRFQNCSGNFIQLTKYMSPHVKKEIGLLITVGTLLLPYQTFADTRKDQCGLLIPLAHDPPLVGANQYHAAQYALQMDIMAELSKNSIELANQGCVKISPQRWEELARQSGLHPSILTLIHERWTRDGDNAAMFLEQITKHHYTLGKTYFKELQFLKAQGRMRMRRSHAGKKSAAKRKGTI